jgi:hypothetical protein
VEALVNTVNEVGVMGKGIALMFKERFPLSSQAYMAASNPGAIHLHSPKRMSDAWPRDRIWFEESETNAVRAFMEDHAAEYLMS